MKHLEKILSFLSSQPAWAVSLSPAYQSRRDWRKLVNFYCADKLLLVYVLFWIYKRLSYRVFVFPSRSLDFFTAQSLTARYFLEYMLREEIWYALLIPTVLSAILLWKYSGSIVLRVTLFVGVALLKLPEESFGYHGHGDRFLMLLLFLWIFAFPSLKLKSSAWRSTSQSYDMLLTGLLFSYFLAGYWKLYPMLLYHPWNQYFEKDGFLTWLSVDAFWLTSFMHFYPADLDISPASLAFEYRYVFQILVVLTILMQCLAFIGAWRRPLLLVFVPVILLFHQLSQYFLLVNFGNKVLLLLVTFPYHLFFFKKSIPEASIKESQFRGKYAEAHYERKYEQGMQDSYKSSYAYRAYLEDKHNAVYILMYLPFICSVLHLSWKVFKKNKATESTSDRH